MAAARVAAALAAALEKRNGIAANASADSSDVASLPPLPDGCVWEKGFSRYTITASAALERPLQIHDTVKVTDTSGAVISLKGKPKIAIVDNCKETSVAFDGALVCGLEVVNSTGLKLSVGAVPSLSIDKSSGVVITLSAPSQDAIVAAPRHEFSFLEPSSFLPDQLVWCDSSGITIQSSDPSRMLFCVLPPGGGAMELHEAVASLELARPEGVDPRKQLQTKFAVLAREGGGGAAKPLVIGVITRPFELFDDLVTMAPPGFGGAGDGF